MPYAATRDGTRLYFAEAGSGAALVFVHEFGGDHRSWEMQMRNFSRRYRCIAYAARGYTPSDVPASPDVYSYAHMANDLVDLLDNLKIEQAHLCGLSMGGYTTLQIGLDHPDRALSLTLAGTGSGAELDRLIEFRIGNQETAEQFEKRITFEYVLIGGKNDTDQDADALAKLARKMHAHVHAATRNSQNSSASTMRRARPM